MFFGVKHKLKNIHHSGGRNCTDTDNPEHVPEYFL